MKQMKKVLLLLLTISVTTMAQEVSFIINDVKEYVTSSNHETTSFADLQTWDNPGNNWGMHYRYNVKPWTNLGDALPLTSDEACIFDMRHNGSNYAGESVHWFTIQCVTPSYTRAVYELKYRLKSYHYHNSTAHRTAYFDYNNDANGYWKNRNKTPDGQTYFNTASKETFNTSTTNKEAYTYSGEAAAVRISGYLSGNYSTQCYDALYSLPEVEIDNRLNTTENTYKRYGAISASKMKASVSNDKIHYTNVNMAYTVKALYCYKYLTYKANGGTGEDQTQTVENAGITKAANTFSREGYVFSKWTTNADGTGTAYEANAAIEATLDSKGPVTLYAQWTSTLVPTTYIDENGVEQTINAWEVTNASEVVTWGVAGETTWYVVKGTDVQLIKGAVCLGDVHLILADGAKLTATGAESNAGIQVSGAENSLAIYGQINQSGQLIAEGGDLAAGIGGGAMASGSNITINGGTVTANGKLCAAGIGGGTVGSGSNITINRGTVKAKGGNYGAGIGGGNLGDGSNIIINGGTVEATGGEQGAGIGGGCERVGSNITINGGTVKAISTYAAAGIGGGAMASGSNITINGGTVTAECRNANTPGDAIGNGAFASTPASNIFVTTSLVIKAGDTENPTTEIAVERTSTTDIAADLVGKQYATVEKPKGNLTVESFVVSDNNVPYNGEAKAATVEFADGIIGAGEMTVTYKQSDAVIASPISAGEYDIYVAVAEGDNYNAFEAAKISTLTIAKATPSADLFTFTAPEDLTWDGNTKTATVTFDDQDGKLSGMGTVTVKYNGSTDAPSASGDYIVSIDVAEGDNYESATALTDEDWKFTIVAASATYTRDVANDSWGTLCLPWASVKLEGGIYYEVLGTKDPEQGVALVELGESDQLTAGKPYVFKATSEQIKVTYDPATEVEDEVEGNNIIGSFDGCNVPEGKYIIVNNLLYKTADATSTIAANRAYFDVDAMGEYTPSQAPGRKVVFMGGRTTPTDLETVDNAQCTMHDGKYIHKGRFVFVKDGKMYNALGM